MYKNLSVADMLHLTRNLNRRFDDAAARARLTDLGIPLKKKTGKLSGGQQAQVALTLALARRPRLLILDEPLSALDPLARQDFMSTVMTAMADDGVSVLLSSHALAELERVADYLIVLGGGELRIAGEVDALLAGHRVLTGPAADADRLASQLSVVQDKRAGAQAHLLVRAGGPDEQPVPPGWEAHPVGLEELVLAYLRPAAPVRSSAAVPGPGANSRRYPDERPHPARPAGISAPRRAPCRGGGCSGSPGGSTAACWSASPPCSPRCPSSCWSRG